MRGEAVWRTRTGSPSARGGPRHGAFGLGPGGGAASPRPRDRGSWGRSAPASGKCRLTSLAVDEAVDLILCDP